MADNWKPNLFVPGFPQCGTTALCDYLKQHPDIYFLDPKEPSTLAIGEGFPPLGTKHARVQKPFCSYLDYEEYKEKFEQNEGRKYRAEGSQTYIWPPAFPKRLKKFSPNARLIFMIRDQKQRLVSVYFRTFERHLQPNFLHWIEKFFLPDMNQYLFTKMLTSYYDLFRDCIRVIKNDSLERSPQQVMDQICKFLGVNNITIAPLHSNMGQFKSLNEYERRKLYRYLRIAQTITLPAIYFLNCINSGNYGVGQSFKFANPIAITKKHFTQTVEDQSEELTRMINSIPSEVATKLNKDYLNVVRFCTEKHLLLAEL